MAVEDLASRKVNVQDKPRVVAAAPASPQVTSSRPAITPAPPEENIEPPRDSMPPDPAPMDLNQGEG